MKTRKKINFMKSFSAALAVCMLIAFTPSAALQANAAEGDVIALIYNGNTTTYASYDSFYDYYKTIPITGLVATIQLLDDVKVVDDISIWYGETITIDLNGHCLSTDSTDMYTLIDNWGNLTINDSASGGSMEYYDDEGMCISNSATSSTVLPELTINGGTFKGSYAAFSNGGTVTMNGGTLDGSSYGFETMLEDIDTISFIFNAGTVKGGLFAFSEYDYDWPEDAKWTGYTIPESTSEIVGTATDQEVQVQLKAPPVETSPVAELTMNGNTEEYKSVEAALADVPSDGTATIKLIDDSTVKDMLEIEADQKITLDLNGYSLSANSIACIITNEGNLTVNDSGSEGNMINSTLSSGCIKNSGGTLTINDGTFFGTTNGIFASSGTVNMNGGAIGGAKYAFEADKNGDSEFNFNAGSVTGGIFAFGLYEVGVADDVKWTGYKLGEKSEIVKADDREVQVQLKAPETTTSEPTETTTHKPSKSGSHTITDDSASGPKMGETSGWTNIDEKVLKANSGETLDIDMNGTTKIPKTILSDIKGKDITLNLDFGTYSWTINGKNITTAQDVDLSITYTPDVISSDIVMGTAGSSPFIQLQLHYNGSFGFTGSLTVELPAEMAGQYANLYYYNPETKKLELYASALIQQDGTATFNFSHASDYVIVMDKTAKSGNLSAGESITDNAKPITQNGLPYAMAVVVVAASMIAFKKIKAGK